MAGTHSSTLVAKFSIRSDAEAAFAAWQARAVIKAAVFPGFINSEMTPPLPAAPQWRLQLHFQQPVQLDAWRKSRQWHALIAEAQSLLVKETSIQLEIKETGDQGGVIEVIITKVRKGKEEAYRKWEAAVQREQARFAGYQGAYVHPPASDESGWMTFMRFESEERLDAWLKSPERARLVRELAPLIDYTHLHRMDGSFPGWFPTDPKTGKGPDKWKTAMLVLLGLFPGAALVTRFVRPELLSLKFNGTLSLFIGNILTVAGTTWLTMPIFIKVLHWWLFPAAEKSRPAINAAGAAVVGLLYALEIAVLWHFL